VLRGRGRIGRVGVNSRWSGAQWSQPGAKISYFNKSHITRVSSGIFTYYTFEARRHSSQLYCMHYIAFFMLCGSRVVYRSEACELRRTFQLSYCEGAGTAAGPREKKGQCGGLRIEQQVESRSKSKSKSINQTIIRHPAIHQRCTVDAPSMHAGRTQLSQSSGMSVGGVVCVEEEWQRRPG